VVLLAISLVLLRPLPDEPFDLEELEISDLPAVAPASSTIRLKRPQASLIGLTLAAFGTFGLAASGILWNFQGIAFGLSGTLTSVVALLLSIPFLWPIGSRRPEPTLTVKRKSEPVPVETIQPAVQLEPKPAQEPEPQASVAFSDVQGDTPAAPAPEAPATGAPATVQTTAEAIAAELAAAQKQAAPVELVTFAPQNLVPGGSLPSRKRRPGASMKGYRGMVEELFRS